MKKTSATDLAKQLIAIHRRRDAGLHSLGEIWRRHRLSCPSRQELTDSDSRRNDDAHAVAVGVY